MCGCLAALCICILLSLQRKSEAKNTINSQKSALCFKTIDFFKRRFLFNVSGNINRVFKFVLFLKSARLPFLFLSAAASHFGKLLKEFNSLLNIQSFILFKSARKKKITKNQPKCILFPYRTGNTWSLLSFCMSMFLTNAGKLFLRCWGVLNI